MHHCLAGGNCSAHGTQAAELQRWYSDCGQVRQRPARINTSKAAAETILSLNCHIWGAVDMSGDAEKVEPAESEQDEEEDVYEVERIIDMRVEEVNL